MASNEAPFKHDNLAQVGVVVVVVVVNVVVITGHKPHSLGLLNIINNNI